MKPHLTLYQGRRWPDLSGRQQRLVTVDGRELLPDASRRLLDCGQDQFNWGFAGEGPAQLALAILLDYLEDPGRALELRHPPPRERLADRGHRHPGLAAGH